MPGSNFFCFKNFGLRPYKPSVAVAIAEGEKSSATAVDLRPSVDPWFGVPPLAPGTNVLEKR